MLTIHQDKLSRIAYATDASAYRELPMGVAFPKSGEDIIDLIGYAKSKGCSLIPRAGGTSLAGQVVGSGIVVDVSRYMNKIIEINPEERWARVEPGLVLDELNLALKPHGLFFSPETSTSNRCCLGGMTGNNSCGSHSLVYGSTRDHLLEANVILSDGFKTRFRSMTKEEVVNAINQSESEVERNVYQYLHTLLADEDNRAIINREYPDKALPRRNTGYALDLLMDNCLFTDSDQPFNLCRLLAGSEGTLAFVTELKLNLSPLPPTHSMLMAVHCIEFVHAFDVNIEALRFEPTAVEMIDYNILDLSKKNLTQQRNRDFIVGEPKAIILIELAEESEELMNSKADEIERSLKQSSLGYAYPRLYGSEINKVWALRKAGLGLLSSMPGDAKPVPLTEDTAVAPLRMKEYIGEFDALLARYNLSCVYYGHIATGELHLRPILNLKENKDVELFREVGREVAKLVKKHKGSLSGEHGDGRLRGEFIPIMYGETVYGWFKELKKMFDPQSIFNPNKIIDTPPMNDYLRFVTDGSEVKIDPLFGYAPQSGVLQNIEQCNGSADCRKSVLLGGTLCPTYKATRNELYTTRARANVLRELLTRTDKNEVFRCPEIEEILRYCVSCKGCKSECPSNVDMAKIKAEITQLIYDEKGAPFKNQLIAALPAIQRCFANAPSLFNCFTRAPFDGILKKMLGFAAQREIPSMSSHSLRKKLYETGTPTDKKGEVWLFVDEFTKYNDAHIGVKARDLLYRLGYEVKIVPFTISGRILLSKGFVRRTKQLAEKHFAIMEQLITKQTPLIGIEPSCLLTFRDEYRSLLGEEKTEAIASNTLLFDEWFAAETQKGNITQGQFDTKERKIIFHGHCHQKALASTSTIRQMLSLPVGHNVTEINSGCCGMAGSFGYEKESYDLSMKIGELRLFPTVRQASADTIVAASGTSCRPHIKHGTGRDAIHPIELMWEALIK